MTEYRRSLGILFGFLIALEGALAAVFIGQPAEVGDEFHLVRTVIMFGHEISLRTIAHYPEMSPPLPFILYALWGRVLNFDVETLRWLSVVVAFAAYLFFFHVVYLASHNAKLALAATVYLALIPYMLGFSIYVLTDMWAILCVVIGCWSIQTARPALLGLASAAGLLCRQYFAFFPLAAGAYFLSRILLKKDRGAVTYVVSLALSTLPLLFLFVLWRGPSPDNPLKNLYMYDAFSFHPSSFNLYVAVLPVYLFPFVLFRARALYRDRVILLITAVAALYYWSFPIGPSRVSLDIDIHTVGILDRVFRATVGEQLGQYVFFGLFLLGLPIVLSIVVDAVTRLNRRQLDTLFFLDLSALAFLVVMPFSYLGWEKYLMPVVPLLVVAMILKHQEESLPAPRPAAELSSVAEMHAFQ